MDRKHLIAILVVAGSASSIFNPGCKEAKRSAGNGQNPVKAAVDTAGPVSKKLDDSVGKVRRHEARYKNPAGEIGTQCEWEPGVWGDCCHFPDGTAGPCNLDKDGAHKVPNYVYNSDGSWYKIKAKPKRKPR